LLTPDGRVGRLAPRANSPDDGLKIPTVCLLPLSYPHDSDKLPELRHQPSFLKTKFFDYGLRMGIEPNEVNYVSCEEKNCIGDLFSGEPERPYSEL
jgi:hypothetical protein